MRFATLAMIAAATTAAGCSFRATQLHVHVAARHPLGEAVAVDLTVANATMEFKR